MTNLNPIKISNYKTREERIKLIDSFSWRDLFSMANLATILFVVLDFVVLFSRWDTVQTESWYMVALLAVSSAVILDVPMMLAGKAIVDYQHKLKSKGNMLLVVILAVAAFALVFGFSIWFSYVTRNETFQDAEASMMINNMATPAQSESGERESVLAASLFSGVLPLGTSIASLVIALFTYKPIEEKRKKIFRARVMAQEHLLHLRQGIAESQAYIERDKKLLAREKDLYDQFVASVYAQELVRKNAYKEALEEKCSLDEVNHIIESAKALNESSAFDDRPFLETYKSIEKRGNPPLDVASQSDSTTSA